MVEYSPKTCELCGVKYTPTSPKQKVCITCKPILRKQRQSLLDKSRNRKNHNILYTRNCLVCDTVFETYDYRKLYCGAKACHIERKRRNNASIQEGRKETYKPRRQELYYINRVALLDDRANLYRKKHPEAKPYIPRTHKHSYVHVKRYFEDRGYTLISEEYKNNIAQLVTKCPKGHTWLTNYHSFEDKPNGMTGNRCLHCYAEGNFVSRLELKVRGYLENNYPGVKAIYNDRTVIKPYELDVYFPEHKLAVELCGLYWHGELQGSKPKDYHHRKMMLCYEKEVRLITVFEDEVLYNFDIVMSRITQALGVPSRRIFARKCKVVEVKTKEANEFLRDNHIQGASTAIVCYGLTYQDELVAVASLGESVRKHTASEGVIEFKRFCTKTGVSVVGGVSRLFTYLKEFAVATGYTIIKSHCDMRYANIAKPVYELLGFELEGFTKYTPHYFKDFKRYRNISLRKTPEERLTGKTEWELRKEQGYDRIWDCGHRTYTYKL